MKILFYNLGYARGIDGSALAYRQYGRRILHQSIEGQKKTLAGVARLVAEEKPDLFAFVELTKGTWRNRKFDQAKYLQSLFQEKRVEGAEELKYHSKFIKRLPYHAGNVNGYIAFTPVSKADTHTLSAGNKRLVFKITIDTLTIFVVHLSLRREKRVQQLRDLAALVSQTEGDIVVCGDMNLFHGLGELDEFVSVTKLRPAGEDEPTFPSFSPKMQLDLFLYRFGRQRVTPKLDVRTALYSDHLPIILEWND